MLYGLTDYNFAGIHFGGKDETKKLCFKLSKVEKHMDI